MYLIPSYILWRNSLHCSSILLKNIIQLSIMMDIAPPMTIIDPYLPAQDSSSVRLHHDGSESDTFYPLPEMPAAALTMSIDMFSVLIFLRHLVHALWPCCPCASLTSMPFVLCPLSLCNDGTVFLSFSVELLPKIGTQSEMERK